MMDEAFWLSDLLIPVIMFAIGVLWKKHPPKKINMIYGYRTKRAMASQQAWDRAHALWGAIWRKLGVVLALFVVVVKLAVPIAPENMTIMILCVWLASIIATIIYVEKRLKQEFGGK